MKFSFHWQILSLILIACHFAHAEFQLPPPVGLDPDYFSTKEAQLGFADPGDYACTHIEAPTPEEGARRIGRAVTQNCFGTVYKKWILSTPFTAANQPYSATGGYWIVCCTQKLPHRSGRTRR